MEIETERLQLRRPEPDDWEALHRYHSLPEVRRHMLPGQGTALYSRGWVRAAIEASQVSPRRFYGFLMTLRSDGTIIGTCNLSLPPDGASPARMGWDVAQTYWRRGDATEAARALLDFGCRDLGLPRVIAECFADNLASRRVMEKIGMRQRRVGMAED